MPCRPQSGQLRMRHEQQGHRRMRYPSSGHTRGFSSWRRATASTNSRPRLTTRSCCGSSPPTSERQQQWRQQRGRHSVSEQQMAAERRRFWWACPYLGLPWHCCGCCECATTCYRRVHACSPACRGACASPPPLLHHSFTAGTRWAGRDSLSLSRSRGACEERASKPQTLLWGPLRRVAAAEPRGRWQASCSFPGTCESVSHAPSSSTHLTSPPASHSTRIVA